MDETFERCAFMHARAIRFRIWDWGLRSSIRPYLRAGLCNGLKTLNELNELNELAELYTISYCEFHALHDLVILDKSNLFISL
jgi:hypothetical protein